MTTPSELTAPGEVGDDTSAYDRGLEPGPEAMKPPAATWWRQRSFFAIEVGALIVLGIGIAADFLPGSRYWIGIFVGGLVALALALAIGGLYTVHDAWEQHRKLYVIWRPLERQDRRDRIALHTKAENAFGLGFGVSRTPSTPAEIRDQCQFLRSFCTGLSLPLSPEIYESLVKAVPKDREEMATLSASNPSG